MKYILLLFAMITFSFASIGKITAINGEAFALRGATAIPLKLNSPIEKKDKIKTMANTRLQIVFNDHTVISLGQKTEFKIDDYIYSTSKVKANFSVSKGIFKSITGKIGKIDHSKFKLKTKNATIGVRGTTFIGVVDRDKETIACTSGEIVVENDFGIVAVKRGEMTIVKDFQPPKIPKSLNEKFFQKVKSIKPAINSENVRIQPVKKTVLQEVKTNEIVTKNGIFSNDIKQEIPQVFVDKTEIADKNSIKENDFIKVFKSIVSEKEDKIRENNYGKNIADIAKNISDSTTQNVNEFFGSDKQTKTDKKDKWFNKNKKEDKTRENNHGNNIADIAKNISDSTTQNVNEFFGSDKQTKTDKKDKWFNKNKKEDKTRENNYGKNIADIAKNISDSTTQNVNEFFGSDKQTKTDKKDKWFNKNKKEDKTRENNYGKNIADIAKNISDSTTQNVNEFFGGNLKAEEGGDFSTIDMEQENSQQDSMTEVVTSNDLERLREKVGGVDRLHYSGMVSGDNIVSENNHINLDFDLGRGRVSGNVQFTTEKHIGFISTKSDWNTNVAGGFDSGGKFNLQAVSDGYGGSGSVELVGEHLEQAQGSMSLTKEGFMLNETVDVDFTANKTN